MAFKVLGLGWRQQQERAGSAGRGGERRGRCATELRRRRGAARPRPALLLLLFNAIV